MRMMSCCFKNIDPKYRDVLWSYSAANICGFAVAVTSGDIFASAIAFKFSTGNVLKASIFDEMA